MDFTRWRISKALQFGVAESDRCSCVWEGLEKEARPLLVPVHGLWEKWARSCTNHSENGVSTCSCLLASYTWNLGEFFLIFVIFFFLPARSCAGCSHAHYYMWVPVRWSDSWKLLQESICCPLDSDLISSLILMQIYREESAGGCIQVSAPAECVSEKKPTLLPIRQFRFGCHRSLSTGHTFVLFPRKRSVKLSSLLQTHLTAHYYIPAQVFFFFFYLFCNSSPEQKGSCACRECLSGETSLRVSLTQKFSMVSKNLPNYPWSNDAHFSLQHAKLYKWLRNYNN